MQLSRSVYYYHTKSLKLADKYSELKQKIIEIYHRNKGRYGYRRVMYKLRELGYKINHKTVLRLMKFLGLKSKIRQRKYSSYRGNECLIAPNILERNFKADRPNQKWVTDITEFSLLGSKLYLSPILDLYNGEIVSYSISARPNIKDVMSMLSKGLKKLQGGEELILHSDQGWQYKMRGYQNILKERGVQQSMSRKGNCLDNAVIENFFGLLKSELYYIQKFSSADELKKEIVNYIKYYNNDRIKVKLNGMSPVNYRAHYSNS